MAPRLPTWLSALVRTSETHCYRCGQPIDWGIPFWDGMGGINPDAGTVEHVIPQSQAPRLRLDPANCKASHQHCNVQAGDRTPRATMGMRTQEW